MRDHGGRARDILHRRCQIELLHDRRRERLPVLLLWLVRPIATWYVPHRYPLGGAPFHRV
jgi:hypothetical protein